MQLLKALCVGRRELSSKECVINWVCLFRSGKTDGAVRAVREKQDCLSGLVLNITSSMARTEQSLTPSIYISPQHNTTHGSLGFLIGWYDFPPNFLGQTVLGNIIHYIQLTALSFSPTSHQPPPPPLLSTEAETAALKGAWGLSWAELNWHNCYSQPDNFHQF